MSRRLPSRSSALRGRQVDDLASAVPLYEVTGGRISIDGQDIRDVTQK